MGRLEMIYRSGLPHRAIVVYMYLSDRAGKEGQCFPSIPTIARQTNLAQNTVRRAIHDLEKGGFLNVTERQRPNGAASSNLYTLTNAEPGWQYLKNTVFGLFKKESITDKGPVLHFDGTGPLQSWKGNVNLPIYGYTERKS